MPMCAWVWDSQTEQWDSQTEGSQTGSVVGHATLFRVHAVHSLTLHAGAAGKTQPREDMCSAPVSLQHSPQASPAEGRMRGGRRPRSAQQSLQQAPGALGAAAPAAGRRWHTAGSVEGTVGAALAAQPGHKRQQGSAQTARSGSTCSSGASQQVTTGTGADPATDAELQADSAGMGTWAGRQTRFPWAERTASQFTR